MASNPVVCDRVPSPPIHGWLIEGEACKDLGIEEGFVIDESYVKSVMKIANPKNQVTQRNLSRAELDKRTADKALSKAGGCGDADESEKLKEEIEELKRKITHLKSQLVHVVEIIPEWFDMPKNLGTLNVIKKPLYHGWTFDEVVVAMTPYLKVLSRKYATTQCPMEECMINGYVGIQRALEKDKAKAPFAKYSYRWIQTKIRRAAMTSGLIHRGERDGDLFGNLGATLGWTLTGISCAEIDLAEGFTPNIEDFRAAVAWNNKVNDEISKIIQSELDQQQIEQKEAELESRLIDIEEHGGGYCYIDAPVGDDSSLRDVLEDKNQDHVEKTEINEFVQVLLRKADLTNKQRTVLVMLWGLDDHVEMGATDVAKELRISKARVGHISKRGMRKIREAALEMGLETCDRKSICDILAEEDERERKKEK